MASSGAGLRGVAERCIGALTRFNIGLGSASGLSTLLMMLIIVPDVVGRKFFNVTVPAAAEIGVFLLLGKIFLGLPGAQASEANFHVAVITERLSERWRLRLRLVATVLAFGVFALLSVLSIGEAFNSWQRNEVTYGVHTFPVWPGRILVAVGLSLLTLQLLADACRLIFGLRPPGVEREGSGLSPE